MDFLNKDYLLKVSKPSRYIGHEVNAVIKDHKAVDVTVALAFPDVYEVGMSHLGLKILYGILNSHEWIAAERVFSPWPDMEDELRKKSIPLSTLESDTPLNSFDVVGISLQHELCYTNILTMLNLAGIPFLSSERDDSYPLIVGGGPACFNPEPVADIFDAILIGDGEEAVIELCRVIRDAKKRKKGKRYILDEMSRIKGFYIPSFFKPHYDTDNRFASMEPLVKGYERVEKVIIADMNRAFFPVDQVVPCAQLIHDRLAIEISRGCTRGCRFCQAGIIYRPVRERTPGDIIDLADRALNSTGFSEISLLSLSAGDYSFIASLLKELMDRQAEKKVAVSLPSLRIDSIDPAWFDEIKRVRKTGFTLAPEAGTDRLRRIINKTLTNDEIIKTARDVYSAGWKLIKLYFMIGLPGETEDDLYGIIDLARKVAACARSKGKKEVLNISVAAFVPKSHTPFMWEPQIGSEESMRRINVIRDAFQGPFIRVKWNQPEISWLEGMFSRGDRRLLYPLIRAWERGARFDAWSEYLNLGLWKECFMESQIDPAYYLHRRRGMDEKLPWGHISSGVSLEYLKEEYENCLKEITTPDCRKGCLECGVCDFNEIRPRINSEWSLTEKRGGGSISPDAARQKSRLRVTFTKRGPAGFASHLELIKLLTRSFKRTGLDIVFSEGFHPMPKLSFACALPVGTESLCETLDMELYGPVNPEQVKEDLNHNLPEGVRILDVRDITGISKGMAIKESHYHMGVSGIKIDRELLEDFINSDSFEIIKRSDKGVKKIDARKMVKSIGFISDSMLELIVTHTDGPELKPSGIIAEIFRINPEEIYRIKVLKVKQITG
ncbi:MAG: TIGR03960 family B12-binding radical SAM protein [Desulfatiglans sp.]|nr:TIGR03960 family B12-binding radical SAM protein [Desulfatiglans sp.]